MGVYVKSLSQLLESWDKIEADADEKKQIFAFLLYHTSQENINNYVFNYSYEIGEMAGRSCKLFMIAHPPKEYLGDARYQQWVEEFHGGPQALDELRGFPVVYSPYSPSRNQEVATALGLKPDQLPCIVFFKDFKSHEIIVCPIPTYVYDKDKAKDKNINSVILGRFRDVFSAIQFSANEEREISPEKQRDERWRRLEKYVKGVTLNDKIIEGYETFKREAKSIGEIFKNFLSLANSL